MITSKMTTFIKTITKSRERSAKSADNFDFVSVSRDLDSTHFEQKYDKHDCLSVEGRPDHPGTWV